MCSGENSTARSSCCVYLLNANANLESKLSRKPQLFRLLTKLDFLNLSGGVCVPSPARQIRVNTALFEAKDMPLHGRIKVACNQQTSVTRKNVA